MADNQLNWDFLGQGTGYNPNTAPAKSKIDNFKDKTFKSDGTKVGGIEEKILPTVGKALENAKKGPLSFIVNPALIGIENVYTRVIQPVQQGVSTAILMDQSADKFAGQGVKGIVNNFRYAQKQSKKISMGQALATGIGQEVGRLLPDAITPTYMDKNFDVFNDKKRSEAFRDEWTGIIASGSTDLVLNLMGSKGTGMATRAAATKVRGASKIVTPDDMNVFKSKADEAVLWAEGGTGGLAPSGLASLMDDVVKETNVQRLSANPLISETSNPYRTATIASRIDNHRDLADYLMAERGDVAAFDRFFKKNALSADHLDNYGFTNMNPISKWSQIHDDVLVENLAPRYQAIIGDLKTKDKGFAAAMDDWASNKVVGVTENYTPGRFGALESAILTKNKVRARARFGDLKIFGSDAAGDSWKTTVYQSAPYDRAVRIIAWTGSGRPQGYINISNPRKFEAANDLLSDLNRLQFLRGAEGVKFKRQMVEKYLSGTNNTEHAIALAEIERAVMLRLAQNYNVKSVGGVETDKALVAKVKEWHAETSNRRTTAQEYAAKQGLIPDEGGNLNVIHLRSQTTEVNNMPMLDFRKLEMEVIFNTKRLAGARSTITTGELVSARVGRAGMTAGMYFDIANMLFNNLNLLRVAYIPKNSMVDPFMRGSMAMESTELVTNAVPGFKNLVHNSSLRTDFLKRYVPGTAGFTARKAEQEILKQMDVDYGNLSPMITKMESTIASEAKASATWQSARTAQAKAEEALKKAPPSSKAVAQDAKHKADQDLFEAQVNFQKAVDDARLARDAVQGVSTIIEKSRAKITQGIRREGDLKQRKYMGQEATFIEVDGKRYNIQGLADPNARGASVYLNEVDSSSNLYSKLFESEATMNIRARGNLFVKIDRNNGPAYFNAIAHIANRQIRQELDMPLGMMLRGETDQAIMNFLYKTAAGKEYRTRMSAMARKDLSSDDFLSWASETSAYMQKLIPSKELRDIILERPVTVKEVTTLMKNRPDLLPSIDGPNISLSDLSKGEQFLARAAGAQNVAWKALAVSENRLVRNPMFLSYTREEMQNLIASARRAGIDPSDSVVNHQFRQIAYREALKRVEETLYSSRRLTNGMYALRYAMAFPFAFFNSQAVALKLIAKNPANAYWYTSVTDALSKFEPYQDQEGNTYATMADVPPGTPVSVGIPISSSFTNKLGKIPGIGKSIEDALAPYSDPRGGGLKWNPKQMEFMVADPSIAWFGSVLVSSLIKNQFDTPLWKTPDGEKIVSYLRDKLGDDFYENSILYGGYVVPGKNIAQTAFNSIAPGYAVSALGGVAGGERFMDQVYTSWKTSYAEWDREGRVGNPPSMNQARKAASNMGLLRGIIQFNMPISTTFDPVTRAATAYYSDLVDQFNGDYTMADAQLIKEWGMDAIALLGSNQNNIGGLAATQADIRMIRKNKDLAYTLSRIDPKYASMMSTGYGDITSDYSPEIAEIYKNFNFPGTLTKVAAQKTDVQVAADVEARRGWAEYNKAVEWRDSVMYQYGITSTMTSDYEMTGIKKAFDDQVNGIKEDFPGWVADRNAGAKNFWDQTIPAIKAIANNSTWRNYADDKDAGKWAEISYWINRIETFKAQAGVAGNTESRDYALKTDIADFHYRYIQQASDGFSAFASRWLEAMPELDPGRVLR